VDEDRRKFLMLMGLVGLGSSLAMFNLGTDRDWQGSTVEAATVTDTPASTETETIIAETETAQESLLTDSAAGSDLTDASATGITLEDAQTVTETQTAVAACTIRCPRGCSFPGHCRRYVDQNGNGKCDLGECL
jgi:hypothetical protein